MKSKDIQWTPEKVSSLWNFYAENEPYKNLYFSKIYGKKILKLSKLPIKTELDILDFGCGPGHIYNALSELKSKWNYHALDFSNESINRVNQHIGKPKFKSALHVNSLPTPLPDNSFDIVVLIEVIEHLTTDECNNTFDEIYRLLKPGGIILITTPNCENLANSMKFCPECHTIFHEWQHIKSWSTQELKETALRKNFTLQKLITTNIHASTLRRAFQIFSEIFGIRKYEKNHIIAIFQKE